MNPTAAKALIYATVIADRLVEKHGPQDDGKCIEHKFEWPTFWPGRLRPSEGKFYQTATEHLEIRIIASPDYCYIRLTFGDRIWRTDDGDPIH